MSNAKLSKSLANDITRILRISYKEDIQASAELVYGTILKLPGEYFTFEDPIECPQTFVEKLRECMRQVRRPTTAHYIKHKIYS